MRENLIDKLDTMLIRTIADIDEEWEGDKIGEDLKDEVREAYEQIKKLIQQQPRFTCPWTTDMIMKIIISFKDDKLELANWILKAIDRKAIDPEEIIQAVLEHVDCSHATHRDEDGTHDDAEYDVDDKCHEAVRKVLGVGE